jgi:hypothetical protein
MIAATLCVPALAMAQVQGAPPPAEGGMPAETVLAAMNAPPESKLRIGLNVVPMPFGTVKGSGSMDSADTAFAFGIMPFADYLLTPNMFVGFSPSFTFNVKPSDGNADAAKEIDLMLRLGGQAPISDVMQLYGYLTPGFSIIMIPNRSENAKGFALGIHAGAMYSFSQTVFFNGELGYQIGYQTISGGADFKVSYMQIALGGGIRL